jgi:hypothetical protein
MGVGTTSASEDIFASLMDPDVDALFDCAGSGRLSRFDRLQCWQTQSRDLGNSYKDMSSGEEKTI